MKPANLSRLAATLATATLQCGCQQLSAPEPHPVLTLLKSTPILSEGDTREWPASEYELVVHGKYSAQVVADLRSVHGVKLTRPIFDECVQLLLDDEQKTKLVELGLYTVKGQLVAIAIEDFPSQWAYEDKFFRPSCMGPDGSYIFIFVDDLHLQAKL